MRERLSHPHIPPKCLSSSDGTGACGQDDNVRIRTDLTQLHHVSICGIIVPRFGLLQRRELHKKRDAGEWLPAFKALQSGRRSSQHFPTLLLHQGPICPLRPHPRVSGRKAKHCTRYTALRSLQAQGPRQAVHPKNASRSISCPHQAPWQQRKADPADSSIIDKAHSSAVPPQEPSPTRSTDCIALLRHYRMDQKGYRSPTLYSPSGILLDHERRPSD